MLNRRFASSAPKLPTQTEVFFSETLIEQSGASDQ